MLYARERSAGSPACDLSGLRVERYLDTIMHRARGARAPPARRAVVAASALVVHFEYMNNV